MEEKKRILEILKSGNFTFTFNDSFHGDLMPKKFKTYKEYSDYYDKKGAESYEIKIGNYGYGLIDLLIEALGGSCKTT